MKYLLFLCLCFQSIGLLGQTFDFHNRKLESKHGILKNQNFTFVIKNINTFKYKILINNETTSNNVETPNFIKTSIFNNPAVSEEKETLTKNFDFLEDKDKAPKTGQELYILFSKLQLVEKFYASLEQLVKSDLPPQSIIRYKKIHYYEFMGAYPSNDTMAPTRIINFYNTQMNNVSKYALEISNSGTVDSILTKIKNIETSKIIYRLAALYNTINDETFTIRRFIAKPDADELKISIVAKNKDENKKEDDIKIEIPFWIQGGIKIDFSTGIFFSSLVNREYINQPNYIQDSLVGYYLIPSDKHPLAYGLSAYIHTYIRSGRSVNMSLSLGLGIDQNTQFKVMPGLSLILGKKERFIISGGASIGKIKDIAFSTSSNQLFRQKIEPIYTESYKMGWYLGISYNLAQLK